VGLDFWGLIVFEDGLQIAFADFDTEGFGEFLPQSGARFFDVAQVIGVIPDNIAIAIALPGFLQD
jgi:hypothetical protein